MKLLKELQKEATEDVLGVPILNPDLYGELILKAVIRECIELAKQVEAERPNKGLSECYLDCADALIVKFDLE